MEPNKKTQNNMAAGLAATGIVAAAAIAVFASTFNPPAQPVVSDTTATTDTGTTSSVTQIPSESTSTSGTVFPTTPKVTTVTKVAVAQTPTPAPAPKPAPVVLSAYRDGTYSATGSYMSPGGEDQIAVTVSLSNDVITSVSATPEAQDRTSMRYQSMFISGYKQYVVGQDIANVHVGRVSGSSLTGIGFNAAISAIKAQAKQA